MKDPKDIKWHEEHKYEYRNVKDHELSYAARMSRRDREAQQLGQSPLIVADPGWVLGALRLVLYIAVAPIAAVSAVIAIPGGLAMLGSSKLLPGEAPLTVAAATRTAFHCLLWFGAALAATVFCIQTLVTMAGPGSATEADALAQMLLAVLSFSRTLRPWLDGRTAPVDLRTFLNLFQSLSDAIAVIGMLLFPALLTFCVVYRRRVTSNRGWWARAVSAIIVALITVVGGGVTTDVVVANVRRLFVG